MTPADRVIALADDLMTRGLRPADRALVESKILAEITDAADAALAAAEAARAALRKPTAIRSPLLRKYATPAAAPRKP